MVSSAVSTCSHNTCTVNLCYPCCAVICIVAIRMHLSVMQTAYLDKGNIWVLGSELHPFWVQCFAGLTPWCKEFDCHQLFRLLALLHNFLQHFLTAILGYQLRSGYVIPENSCYLCAYLENGTLCGLPRCTYQVFGTRNFPPIHMHPSWQNCRIAGCRGKHWAHAHHILVFAYAISSFLASLLQVKGS